MTGSALTELDERVGWLRTSLMRVEGDFNVHLATAASEALLRTIWWGWDSVRQPTPLWAAEDGSSRSARRTIRLAGPSPLAVDYILDPDADAFRPLPDRQADEVVGLLVRSCDLRDFDIATPMGTRLLFTSQMLLVEAGAVDEVRSRAYGGRSTLWAGDTPAGPAHGVLRLSMARSQVVSRGHASPAGRLLDDLHAALDQAPQPTGWGALYRLAVLITIWEAVDVNLWLIEGYQPFNEYRKLIRNRIKALEAPPLHALQLDLDSILNSTRSTGR